MCTPISSYQIEYCDNQRHTDEYYSNFVIIESGGARMAKEYENGKCKMYHCGADNKSERRFINDADINKEVNQFYGRSV